MASFAPVSVSARTALPSQASLAGHLRDRARTSRIAKLESTRFQSANHAADVAFEAANLGLSDGHPVFRRVSTYFLRAGSGPPSSSYAKVSERHAGGSSERRTPFFKGEPASEGGGCAGSGLGLGEDVAAVDSPPKEKIDFTALGSTPDRKFGSRPKNYARPKTAPHAHEDGLSANPKGKGRGKTSPTGTAAAAAAAAARRPKLRDWCNLLTVYTRAHVKDVELVERFRDEVLLAPSADDPLGLGHESDWDIQRVVTVATYCSLYLPRDERVFAELARRVEHLVENAHEELTAFGLAALAKAYFFASVIAYLAENHFSRCGENSWQI